jgi:transcription elongation factor S-II
MATTTAEDLSKLISTAVDSAASAGDDAAETDRAIGALKQLQKRAVTAALLKETEAGKRVNKLTKHSVAAISAAAVAVVQAWKECVKKEQEAKGSGGGGGGGASSSGGGGGVARQGSTASAGGDVPGGSGRPPPGGGGEPPPLPPARSGSVGGGGGGGAIEAARVAPAPGSGNVKRDKARAMMLDGLALCLAEGAEPYAPLGQLAAEVEDALWAANCEGCRDPNAAYLAKVRVCQEEEGAARGPMQCRRSRAAAGGRAAEGVAAGLATAGCAGRGAPGVACGPGRLGRTSL